MAKDKINPMFYSTMKSSAFDDKPISMWHRMTLYDLEKKNAED